MGGSAWPHDRSANQRPSRAARSPFPSPSPLPVQPSFSIIKSTGPFFAIALIVAVLLRAGAAPGHQLTPDEPLAGRFEAVVARAGEVRSLAGDASFAVRREPVRGPGVSVTAGPDSAARGTWRLPHTAVALAADARFRPPLPPPTSPAVDSLSTRPSAASPPSSPRSSSANPSSANPDAPAERTSSAEGPARSESRSSRAPRGTSPGEAAGPAVGRGPRLDLRVHADLRPGDAFAEETGVNEESDARVRYFPEGPCSVPYAWTQGTVSAARDGNRVRGRVRGVLERVNVYRPDPALGCERGERGAPNPSETIRLDVRFDALR